MHVDVEERCTPAICAAPLACVSEQCRTSCMRDDECRTGTCSGGSCVEPVRGAADAGLDATLEAGPAVCDTSQWPADADFLRGLFAGVVDAGAGLHGVPPASIGPFPSPTESGTTLPGQIAIAAHADDASGHAWVGWLEGATGRVHFVEAPLDRPDRYADRDLDGGVITGARSLDLGVDGTSFVGVIARTEPAGPTDFAWVIDEAGTALLTGVPTPAEFSAAGLFGRLGVTGGLSPFGGGSALPVRFVMQSGIEMRILDRALTPQAHFAMTFAAGFLDGAGSLGELYAFRAPDASIRLWDVHDGYTDNAPAITTASDGPPGLAAIGSDPTTAILAYPTGNAITRRVLGCAPGCSMLGPALLGTAQSVAARRVALATSGQGVVLVGLYSDGTPSGTSLALRHVDADGTEHEVTATWTGPTLTASETVVDLRIAAAPASTSAASPRRAGVMVALLIRDASAGMDRVWLGGVYACAP